MIKKVAKGEVCLLTSGEYSDYGIIALCKCEKNVDLQEQYEKYPGEKGEYSFSESAFGDWLIKQGFFSKLKHRELYFGDYGHGPESWSDRVRE